MRLSGAEWEIMEQIWQMEQPITAAELSERMRSKGWKPTTLLTFLTRMVAKGVLTVQKNGKQNLYTACFTSESYRASEAKELLEKLYSGNVKHMVAALYQDNTLTNEQLDELQEWLDER